MGRVAAECSAEACLNLEIVSLLFPWAGASHHAQALCLYAGYRAREVMSLAQELPLGQS